MERGRYAAGGPILRRFCAQPIKFGIVFNNENPRIFAGIFNKFPVNFIQNFIFLEGAKFCLASFFMPKTGRSPVMEGS